MILEVAFETSFISVSFFIFGKIIISLLYTYLVKIRRRNFLESFRLKIVVFTQDKKLSKTWTAQMSGNGIFI